MTTEPDVLDLLNDVDAYLCALHVHSARHDQIGADFTCGGCLLRERVAAALPVLAAVPVPPPTDQTAALLAAADAVFALDYDVMVGEEGDENLGSMREAWDLGTIHAEKLLRRLAAEAQPTTKPETAEIQVWPLKRVLAEVRCGSKDWTWEEEWADLDRRHADTGYLTKLEEAIRENGITMPVLVGSDGRLWDGHHRLRLAVRLGIGYVPVEIVPTAAKPETEAHPPTHAWKVESPRRDKWASWGATHDERVWAAASFEDVVEVAPQRAFRLVRATTTYTVEAEHQPAAGVGQDGAQSCAECSHPKDAHREGEDPVTPGVCSVCDAEDPDEAHHDYRLAPQ